jgi:hypothetical protein
VELAYESGGDAFSQLRRGRLRKRSNLIRVDPISPESASLTERSSHLRSGAQAACY